MPRLEGYKTVCLLNNCDSCLLMSHRTVVMDKRNSKEVILNDILAIPLVNLSIRFLKYWGLLYENNWRRTFFALSMTTVFNATEFVYMFDSFTQETIDVIIRNAYMLLLWFNSILRGYLLMMQKIKYEQFLAEFAGLYKELLNCNDNFIKNMLMETNALGKNMAVMNMVLGHITVLGFCCYPIFADERMLPYGSHIPGVNELEAPYFQILYVYQVIVTPLGCWMYIPFGSLIVSLIMFAIVMCKVLQYRLRGLNETKCSPRLLKAKVIWCIKYQKTIIKYVNGINNLATYVFLFEFICFGGLLCGLLFLINIAETTAQFTIAVTQTSMIFSQLLTLYWYASQLTDESEKIAEAAYDTNWFTFPKSEQKNILLMIMRAQNPCIMTVGNIYPMSLEMFQSLLNASYSYFTLLRRFYG